MIHKTTSSVGPRTRSEPAVAVPQVLADFLSLDMLKFYSICLLWYSSSAVTNNIGKQILNEYNHPMTLTYIQFGLVALFCFLTANMGAGFSKLRSPTVEIIRTTVPLALFQVFGHIFSAIAMSYGRISFTHTIKALSPLFTVLLYRAFDKIIYTPKVYISLIPLTLGVMLVCVTELKFHTVSFLCSLASTLIFVIQNIVAKKLFNAAASKTVTTTPRLDKLNMLFYSAFMAFLLMLPVWIYSESLAVLNDQTSEPFSLRLALLFLLNGFSSFAQSILAFWILSLVSPVTYSIASLVKRIFVITASIFYFHDAVSPIQAGGIGLTFFGLWLYNESKREVARAEAHITDMMERKSGNALPMHHSNPNGKDRYISLQRN
ncbi:hypothetical protein HK105_200496 [Polyrhizophydium stewartii]|uniref:Sugar phosphate transporter domain-containing protein n=1 Tax=Polyrhizophydium stewartii TaxID=2732419 RepID=A0ABR4NJ71_9FUNG|nr:suppressor of loss of ypt1 [Polyrhizophydium stewartii]